MRGPTLGVALAYAWAANPFTLYALDCNVNDALVGRARPRAPSAPPSSPAGRGALVALAGMAKFAPLALAPLFATQSRGVLRFVLGGAIALVPCLLLVLGYGGLHDVLRPHAGLPGLARVAILGLGPVRVDHRAGGGPGRRGAAGRRRRLRAAPARPRRALRAVGGRAHRAAARRHALVLPLHGAGSSGRCSSRCWPTPIPPSATGRRPTPSSSRSYPRPPSPGAEARGQPQAVRGGGRLDARAHAELGQDARDVDAGGLLGDEQRLADLAVGVPLGHQREDGELALGEPEAVDLGVVGGGVRSRASSDTRARRARPSTSAASSGAAGRRRRRRPRAARRRPPRGRRRRR